MSTEAEVLLKFVLTSLEVYQDLEDDGVYGPYALGEELWEKFKESAELYINHDKA